MVKNLPARQNPWVQPLGQEDPMEKGMATHSSILAWRILWAEEPGGQQSVGWQRARPDWASNTFTSLSHQETEWLYGSFIYLFLKKLFFIVAAPCYIKSRRVLISLHPCQHLLFSAFLLLLLLSNSVHLNRYEVMTYFSLHFSDNLWLWVSSPMPIDNLYIFFGKMHLFVHLNIRRLIDFCF